jgi:methenyltetrahydromethanopterin cyclohydrolase
MAAAYTREIRYGLYDDYDVKRNGFIGRGEATRFSTSAGEIYLIVHFTRAQSQELFDVSWSNSSATLDKQTEDVVSDDDWRLYALDISGFSSGRYFVRGSLNGAALFEIPFTVTP